MAKKKIEMETPVEEVTTETPVPVEPEKKKIDLKVVAKKVLKGLFWLGLGAVAFVGAGMAVGALCDDSDDQTDSDDGTVSDIPAEDTSSSEANTGTEG